MDSLKKENNQIDWTTAEDAYHIIQGLLSQVQVANSLIATMSSLLGEHVTQKLIETSAWADYLTQRRNLEFIDIQIKKFTESMNQLSINRPDRQSENGDEEVIIN